MTAIESWLLWPVAAYVVGSVPVGLLIGRLKGLDIRAHGSGNVGATNVGRTLGRSWGIACFVIDLLKGAAPVVGFGIVSGAMWAGDGGGAGGEAGGSAVEALNWLVVATAAIVGHVFPVWLGFRGGKGVATALGAVLGMWPVLTIPGTVAAAVWVAVVLATKYVSLASIAAAAAMPALACAWLLAIGRPVGEAGVYVGACVVLALLVILRHRDNIARLRDGTEGKVMQGEGK